MTDRLTDTELDVIREEAEVAIAEYRVLWPEPAPLSANLRLVHLLLAEVDSLRAERAGIEYGIVRPYPIPSMDGRPRWIQIVSATFSTHELAERALRNVPSLRDKAHAARIVSRRAPGPWAPVEDGDQP